MTINLHDVIIDRSPTEKAFHLKRLFAELDKLGYVAVKTEWLRWANSEILKRKLEEA